MELLTLRTALLITLSLLLLVVLFQRFRRKVRDEGLPSPLHAELRTLEVAYHPARLLVLVHLPKGQELRTTLTDEHHRSLHTWPEQSAAAGDLHLERALPALKEGVYHFELSTATQRTVRRFRLQT